MKKLNKAALIKGGIVFVVLFLIIGLPHINQRILTQQALNVIEIDVNFHRVDSIVLSLGDYSITFNSYDSDFELIKESLNPFYGGSTGFTSNTTRELQRLAYRNDLTIEYFIENDRLFGLSVLLFEEFPNIELSGFARRIFSIGDVYGAAIMNDNERFGFIARFRASPQDLLHLEGLLDSFLRL